MNEINGEFLEVNVRLIVSPSNGVFNQVVGLFEDRGMDAVTPDIGQGACHQGKEDYR